MGDAIQKVSARDLLAAIPGPASRAWPDGEPFAEALKHGTLSMELFAPRGTRLRHPHSHDALYVVINGHATLQQPDTTTPIEAGDAVLLRAGEAHDFERASRDFLTWIIFFGPKGGAR